MAGRPATKKTTTTNKEAEEKTTPENSTSVEVPEKEVTVETSKIKTEEVKKVFTDSDYILCHSVWSGGLNVTCKSGNSYEFKDYGSECEINYRDLVTLIRKGSDHIFLPRFIIDDVDFLNEFPNVKKVYGAMYTMSDLQEILRLSPSQMKKEIEKLPNDTKETLRNLAATEIANGGIDSIKTVRALTEVYGSDFNLLSDLFVK